MLACRVDPACPLLRRRFDQPQGVCLFGFIGSLFPFDVGDGLARGQRSADAGRGVIGTCDYMPAPRAWAWHTISEDLLITVRPTKTADPRSRRPVGAPPPIKLSGGDQLSLAASLTSE